MSRLLMLPAFRISVFTIAIFAFSFFIHHPFPFQMISFTCILLMAVLIALEQVPVDSLFGKSKGRTSMIVWSLISVIGAFIFAGLSRQNAFLTSIPTRLGAFTVLAMMIGSMEEIIFRGWLFSQFKGKWIWPGLLFTSFAHAGYKAVLFFSPFLPYQVDKPDLFINTFEAGIFLGLTRVFSGSVWPALIAHAIFDLLVYGDQQIPWWVF